MATRHLGFAAWVWDSVTLDTVGPTEVNIEFSPIEHKENAYGDQPTDIFYKGVRVTARCGLSYSQANMIRAAGVLASTTTSGYSGLGALIAGVQGSTYAKSLVIHPLANSATADDIKIHKGVMVTDGPINWAAAEDDEIIPVMVTALIDTTQSNGLRLLQLGSG